MTAFTWHVRNRYATGLSAVPAAATTVSLFWTYSSVSAVHLESTLPWAQPEYPTLLVLGVGFDFATDATPGNRRVRLTLTTGASAPWTILSGGVQAAGANRRWEFGVGMDLDTALVGTTDYREPLPGGLLLLAPPDEVSSLVLGFAGAGGANDTYGAVTVRGALLYP